METNTMKDSDKYYTPSIEEFHIGLKCVIDGKNAVVDFTPIDNTMAFCVKNKAIILTENIDLNRIRIKYLDKEDIESCGFVNNNNFIGVDSPMCMTAHGVNSQTLKIDSVNHVPKKSNNIFSKQNNGKEIELIFDKEIIIKEHSLDEGSIRFLFSGKIKNLAELKRILKQIGVDDESTNT